MLACAGIGYLLGRSRGMGLQGFFLGMAFGPIGWGLILLWPRSWIQGPMPRARESGSQSRARPQPRHGGRPHADSAFGDAADSRGSRPGGGCPRCGSPVKRGAGACPRCGNVLVPIRYHVNPGGS
jgi:hypothetical protein